MRLTMWRIAVCLFAVALDDPIDRAPRGERIHALLLQGLPDRGNTGPSSPLRLPCLAQVDDGLDNSIRRLPGVASGAPRLLLRPRRIICLITVAPFVEPAFRAA